MKYCFDPLKNTKDTYLSQEVRGWLLARYDLLALSKNGPSLHRAQIS